MTDVYSAQEEKRLEAWEKSQTLYLLAAYSLLTNPTLTKNQVFDDLEVAMGLAETLFNLDFDAT